MTTAIKSFFAAAAEIERRLFNDPGTDGLGKEALQICGAQGGLPPALVATAQSAPRPHPILYIVSTPEKAEKRHADLTFWSEGQGPASKGTEAPGYPLSTSVCDLWVAPETSPYADIQPDRRVFLRRLALLARLQLDQAPRLIVTSASALSWRTFPAKAFALRMGTVTIGDEIQRDTLSQQLASSGYNRVEIVEDPGTYAVRGGLIDVFPSAYKHPVRIELFGDEVESIRLYDEGTQRTLREIEAVHHHPVRESLLTPGASPRESLLEAAEACAFPSSQIRQLLEQINEGRDFFGIEALAPLFHARMDSLLEHLPGACSVVIEDLDEVLDEVERAEQHLADRAEKRREAHRLTLAPESYVLTKDEFSDRLSKHPTARFDALELLENNDGVADENPDGGPATVRVEARDLGTLKSQLQAQRGKDIEKGLDLGPALYGQIQAWLQNDGRVRVAAPNQTHAERLSGLLGALGLEAPILRRRDQEKKGDQDKEGATAPTSAFVNRLHLGPESPRLGIVTGGLDQGFVLPPGMSDTGRQGGNGDGGADIIAGQVVVVAEQEIFGRRAVRRPHRADKAGFGDLGEIKEGDLVIHEEHGLGRYEGLKKIQVQGGEQDFLQLNYDGGRVYVPVYRLGVIHRHTGAAKQVAKLDKVGGKTWTEKKRKVSVLARKIAEDLLQLYAERMAQEGHAFAEPDAVYQAFEETFPFDETPDQQKAIDATLADLQAVRPMDRLVCGDVGYGKTEVAMRAAMLAVLGGKQVAVLAPTTVLAEQHFVSFSERMSDFPVTVRALSRFRDRKSQSETIQQATEGTVDVVIGTHRILSKDVRFKSLGLVIIDEEQRFGVAHKERLKEMRTTVDVLTLTATPIPRTMQMAMGGLREISIIATAPQDRLAIRTFVCRYDVALLREAIDREMARGGQIFFVHNRVEDIHKWKQRVAELAPGAKVAVAHGQMPGAELERIMVDFVDGRYDILISTTIIEAGLDIPRANTMIVNNADHFGLAQLYQMRGRIGRSRERAYCYLVVPPEKGMSTEARQRLAVLQRFTELGAGFQIASHDLEIRGAGELLGQKQSGALASVGFETYSQILEEAVASLRGEPIRREKDPDIKVDVPAFLPDDYIEDTGQRLDFYRRFSGASDHDQTQALAGELEDRYGALPPEARLLVEVMAMKTVVRKLGALAFELTGDRFVLTLDREAPLDPVKVMALVRNPKQGFTLSPEMRLAHRFDAAEKRQRIQATQNRLEALLALRVTPS